MNVSVLGATVGCVQCGRTSTATDPSNESLAMQDSIKYHAELTANPEPQASKIRTPR